MAVLTHTGSDIQLYRDSDVLQTRDSEAAWAPIANCPPASLKALLELDSIEPDCKLVAQIEFKEGREHGGGWRRAQLAVKREGAGRAVGLTPHEFQGITLPARRFAYGGSGLRYAFTHHSPWLLPIFFIRPTLSKPSDS